MNDISPDGRQIGISPSAFPVPPCPSQKHFLLSANHTQRGVSEGTRAVVCAKQHEERRNVQFHVIDEIVAAPEITNTSGGCL